MPYLVLRGILKISNPMSMVRGVIDLFLAQPFGQRSLAQRMLTSNIQEEVRVLGEMANRIAGRVAARRNFSFTAAHSVRRLEHIPCAGKISGSRKWRR